MVWLKLAIALMAAATASFGASYMSSAWRKRGKSEPGSLRLEAMLPGFDCGLCGRGDCRSYASAINAGGADPALCLPGGDRLERRLRTSLAERPGDRRTASLRAVVRCGGRSGLAIEDFPYVGRLNCGSAALLYGGPKRCKDACIGFGSCAAACPLGAIHVTAGLAIIDHGTCTGCGECAKACPQGVISMLPRGQGWYVACSSKSAPESRLADCAAACTACGECVARSGHSEFGMKGKLSRENPEAVGGKWQEVSDLCPTQAIAFAGVEKKHHSPLPGTTASIYSRR